MAAHLQLDTPPEHYRPRRLVFAFLVGLTVAAGVGLMAATLRPGGIDSWDALILCCFALTLPWTAIGFWNAIIGLAILRGGPRPGYPVPAPDSGPIRGRTALLSCIRDEDTAAVGRNLDRMIAGLVQRGQADRFSVWILSDSHWDECIAAEERLADRLARRWSGRMEVRYRRRRHNAGFKAGNIRDFLTGPGSDLDYALVLDADSLMAPETILDLVRTLEANPRIGLLQALVVGLPSASAFARPFQFGMRLGMRSYTLGSAWWQGDCGPYWGHNALFRVAPFRDHCQLPVLPGGPPLGGWVLSHDQVEAALLRRAGFEVRVIPVEAGSWEENPPTLLEFIRRDLRWCQGNLQYLRLLHLPGLQPVSRVQLLLAVLLFLSSPAWVLFMLLGLLRLGTAEPGAGLLDPTAGGLLFALIVAMIFAPKLATLANLLGRAKGRRAFGGAPRVIVGALAEVLFSTLLAPVMAIAHTVFMAGLPFGRTLVWGPQRRDAHRVGWALALRRLWPQTLVGLAAALWLGATGGPAALWLSPFFIGALIAVPLAVITASPALGLVLARIGLWRIPEETEPSPLIRSLELPALQALDPPADTRARALRRATPAAETAD
jgi:membrane glycosyltransferase